MRHGASLILQMQYAKYLLFDEAVVFVEAGEEDGRAVVHVAFHESDFGLDGE